MPTDVELITQYLAKKVNNEPIPVAEMSEVNLYRYTPHYLAENYPQLGDKEWYLFTPRDRKYPNGNRPKRSVEGIGYWKATGADKLIQSSNGELIGKKKALVFYLGKPKSGEEQKTNWIMHEYKLNTPSKSPGSNDMRLDDWVLCRIYEKPERSNNKKQKDVLDDHVADDEDHENLLAQLVGNDSIEDLASLHIQENNNKDIVVMDQNRGHVPMMINNGYGDNSHQFQPNYNQYGFNQVVPNPMEAAPPRMNFYGQNSNFGVAMRLPYHDQHYYLNEQQQAPWAYQQQGDDYWGNNGNNLQQDPYNINSYFVDDVPRADPDDGKTKSPNDEQQMAPKKKKKL
ncbi:NAC domain-containing protein 19 [Phtheirospermum japonicum]|uniref:NAC domain-containing protein 19 n=1 Tax=Phtheirospermum japonicum TaxID=374723 RepID=A0A830CSF1_9LAMI|nr:NAC domain-containing protein 19 [Phtheirospermum japonicum]